MSENVQTNTHAHPRTHFRTVFHLRVININFKIYIHETRPSLQLALGPSVPLPRHICEQSVTHAEDPARNRGEGPRKNERGKPSGVSPLSERNIIPLKKGKRVPERLAFVRLETAFAQSKRTLTRTHTHSRPPLCTYTSCNGVLFHQQALGR